MSDLNLAVLGADSSYVAAGLFHPGINFCGPTEEITRKWINDAYYYWDSLRDSREGSAAGVTQISGYMFSSQYPHIIENFYLEKLVPLYRQATREELSLCPGVWKYDIDNNYDAVVNCTGLGAKFLCNDNRLVPMRGQVIKMEAPWIKTFFYADYNTYVIPGINCVTLGGCRHYDSYDTSVNKFDRLLIKERCESLIPSLKGAKLIGDRVGLRPYRDRVRVEKEIKIISGKRLKLIHNYGHGSYGVTTAPGTSLYAVELVKEILSGNSKL